MRIFPAVDVFDGKAVRLVRGDYERMTVYNPSPLAVAEDFVRQGASQIHLVDLEGARSGETPNFKTLCAVKERTGLFCQVGGGIRSMEVIDRYLSAGIDRVILGTAAVTEEGFVARAVEKYGDKIAVSLDARDGMVAIKGWTESTGYDVFATCESLQSVGVQTLICTDISKDGAMQGTNHTLYRRLSQRTNMQIIASGGVSSLDDVKRLAAVPLYGAIIGKAYYTGAVSLREAIEVAR